MLRNLLRRSPANRLIAGTPDIGIIASRIISETATGDSGAGLLYDEAGLHTGKQLRVKVTSWTGTAGTAFVYENGSVLIEGQANGAYTLGYDWEAWTATGALTSGSDSATVYVGPQLQSIAITNSTQAIVASAAGVLPTHRALVSSSVVPSSISAASTQSTHRVSTAAGSIAVVASAGATRQTHMVGIASSSAQAATSTAGVSQSSTTFISASSSVVLVVASLVAVRQYRQMVAVSSSTPSYSTVAAVLQRHLVSSANGSSGVASSGAGATQSGANFISVVSSAQPVSTNTIAAKQTHLVAVAASSLAVVLPAVAVQQIRRIVAAGSFQPIAVSTSPVGELGPHLVLGANTVQPTQVSASLVALWQLLLAAESNVRPTCSPARVRDSSLPDPSAWPREMIVVHAFSASTDIWAQ